MESYIHDHSIESHNKSLVSLNDVTTAKWSIYEEENNDLDFLKDIFNGWTQQQIDRFITKWIDEDNDN